MTESDCEIEYLDEDADIVQQCVQTVPLVYHTGLIPTEDTDDLASLLVERRPEKSRKRKKKEPDDDSDYDPSKDNVPHSPPDTKTRKRKIQTKKMLTKVIEPRIEKKKVEKLGPSLKETLRIRKLMNIRIPDYDDPLCLPVKAIMDEETDAKRLNNWNNACIEHFKNCSNILKPENGETHGSVRTLMFKNVINKLTGKVETNLWSKTSVQNEDGDKNSEIFQCVLPRYKEKKVLPAYYLSPFKKYESSNYHMNEVLLAKEEFKDGEMLVVYKPRESLTAVYRAEERKPPLLGEILQENTKEEEPMCLKEVACCKVCAPCFQTSWRGVKKNKRKDMRCPICDRTYDTVYSLLAHYKSHPTREVRNNRKAISQVLAQIVDYHYTCRVCREKFTSIKALRYHVRQHKGNEVFMCEVGNHMTR